MEFKLIPVSREHYDSQVIIYKRKRKRMILKYDELEIKYYLRKGIDIRPKIESEVK